MGGGDFDMTLLLSDIASFFPPVGPWETQGGCDELATVIFLRGALLSNYGFIETQLNELAIRSSYIKSYYELNPEFPRELKHRLEYLSKAFSVEGPLRYEEEKGLHLIAEFGAKQSERNNWAHAAWGIIPGPNNNRWSGTSIKVINYNRGNKLFNMTVNNFTTDQIINEVKEMKSLAILSNEIHCSVTQNLPKHPD
jgi:hypothetical protein